MQKENNLAIPFESDPSGFSQALVKKDQDGGWLVADQHGLRSVRLSLSCLLTPQRDDVVLVHDGVQGAYIVAVLERPGEGPLTIEAVQGLEIKSRQGGVSISARDEVELASASKVSSAAPEVAIEGSQLNFSSEEMNLFSRVARVQIERISLAAQSISSVVQRVSQKMRDCYRWVEGLDLLQAAHITRDARDLYSMRSKYTVISADEDVKVDAEHIHLG